MKTKSWETPKQHPLPRFGFHFKSGNSHLENKSIFFNVSNTSTVLEKLKNIDPH